MKKDKVRVKWIEVNRKSIKPGLRMVCMFPSLSRDAYLGTVETVDWLYKKKSPFDTGHVTLNILIEMPKSNILFGYSYMKGDTLPALLSKRGKIIVRELPYMKPVVPRPAIRYVDKIKQYEDVEEEPITFQKKKKKLIGKKVKNSTKSGRTVPKKGSGR